VTLLFSRRKISVYLHLSIVKVRETRLTVLISHVFIGMSLLMRHVLKQIPMPVLDGLFLYLALTSLDGNQFFERVTLFFTEQVMFIFEDFYNYSIWL
jgi:sodium borate transporter 11